MSLLPVPVSAGDVGDLKRRLRAALQGTDQGVQVCSALDDSERASWGIFYATAMGYTLEPSSFWFAWPEAERGQSYENELFAWQNKLKGQCTLTVPLYNPAPPETDAGSLFKWGTIALVAVASAYVVGRVASVILEAEKVIPKAKRK